MTSSSIRLCFPLRNIRHQKTPDCIKNGNSWIYKERIGKPSAYGEIWQACCQKDCRWVAKYQTFGTVQNYTYQSQVTPQQIEKEVKIQDDLSVHGLTLPVTDSWICKHGGVIIMPALKETVKDVFEQYNTLTVHKSIIKSVVSLTNRLHRKGYYHGDLHLNNIMVDYQTDNYIKANELYPNNEAKRYEMIDYRYYLIDLGNSDKLDTTEDDSIRKRKDFRRFYSDFRGLLLKQKNNEKLKTNQKLLNLITVYLE